ncbi:MAG: ABC transporter permease [Oscillospiraceae bacterium]|jgi:ABC-2 type transport system permease protein|nr:ABC transporter permease [Oscillospiraceae bacterium]
MKSYLAMFRMKFIAGIQYHAAAWAGIATQFFWGFMLIMIYRAFYRSGGAEPPIEWKQLVAYIWLQQSFLTITNLFFIDNDLISGITDGQVAYELCRPYDMYSFWFVRLTAARLSRFVLRFAPILVAAFLLPEPYRMDLPVSAGALSAFLLSMCLSLFLAIAVSMFVYILTFITMTPLGARIIIGIAAEFLAGQAIPIPLMPEWLQHILNFLPYRYISDLPLRLYSGHISGTDALFQIGLQALWVLGLTALGYLAFRWVTRRIVIQGG